MSNTDMEDKYKDLSLNKEEMKEHNCNNCVHVYVCRKYGVKICDLEEKQAKGIL